jgi:hypothetical protein
MSEETEGETPQSPPEGGSPSPLPPVMKPDQTTEDAPPSKTVGGAHDLSGHPAVSSGNVKNVGDTVVGRDPNAPSFRRPPLEIPAEQSEGERTTTTANPAKKASKGKSKGDGAGPES